MRACDKRGREVEEEQEEQGRIQGSEEVAGSMEHYLYMHSVYMEKGSEMGGKAKLQEGWDSRYLQKSWIQGSRGVAFLCGRKLEDMSESSGMRRGNIASVQG